MVYIKLPDIKVSIWKVVGTIDDAINVRSIVISFSFPDKLPGFSRTAGYTQHNSSASNTMSSTGSQRYNKLNSIFLSGNNPNTPTETSRLGDHRGES